MLNKGRMAYKSLADCVNDLKKTNQILVVEQEIDPNLVLAAIQRRVYQHKGPALLFTKVKGTRFPVLTNLFGTLERSRFLFRHSLKRIEKLMQLALEPDKALKKPWQSLKTAPLALYALPKKIRKAPCREIQLTKSELPQIINWPKDGGAFVTLPIVLSKDPTNSSWAKTNLGMYRVQISGNDYTDNEMGLHYQIHRGIGVHQQKAIAQNKPFKVHIFVGGPPSLTLAAIMPLPENISELTFAGLLGSRRTRITTKNEDPLILAEADFCISGTIVPQQLKPEGPFGDHLGYYSLTHPFPFLKIEKVTARKNAIWPATSVGRPPQEDTSFGELIHEITGAAIPKVIPGVKEVHAVDASGVHPLLLAIGTERYTPYQKEKRPQEILTQANAILGHGQLSLAKYLMIANQADNPKLNCQNIPDFFEHVFSRIDFQRDLHFQTQTTIDTLDYTGHGFNQGSKLVIACSGEPKRKLADHWDEKIELPFGYKNPQMLIKGLVAIEGPPYPKEPSPDFLALAELKTRLASSVNRLKGVALILIVDDSYFVSKHINNWLWVWFTRSNPATDVHGVLESIHHKHWGCAGPILIDARVKPGYPPDLIDDPATEKKVDALASQGQPFYGIYSR